MTITPGHNLEHSTSTSTPKEMTWAQKYSLISPWFPKILNQIKRDCKSEHLSIDPHFVRTHFAGKPIVRISLYEMRAVYLQQIFAGYDRLAEFIANRWLFRNMDLYRFFETELEKKIPSFEKIGEIPFEIAEPLIHEGINRFGVEDIFCFAVLNDLALPQSIFEKLQKEALQLVADSESQNMSLDPEKKQLEQLKSEMEKIKERHEKKVEELLKRHKQEVERLTKELIQAKKELQAIRGSKS